MYSCRNRSLLVVVCVRRSRLWTLYLTNALCCFVRLVVWTLSVRVCGLAGGERERRYICLKVFQASRFRLKRPCFQSELLFLSSHVLNKIQIKGLNIFSSCKEVYRIIYISLKCISLCDRGTFVSLKIIQISDFVYNGATRLRAKNLVYVENNKVLSHIIFSLWMFFCFVI